MQSVINEYEHQIEIKKSKFICYLKNVNSDEEAKTFLNAIKTLHPQANHHCSAWRVGAIERANDDGEPSQTAGMPMLNVLTQNELDNTIAIVVRYFGGIKLGAGGLVRAYSASVVQALEHAPLANLQAAKKFNVEASYSDIDKINYILGQLQITDYQISYEQKVKYLITATLDDYQNICKQLNNYNHLIKINNEQSLVIAVKKE